MIEGTIQAGEDVRERGTKMCASGRHQNLPTLST